MFVVLGAILLVTLFGFVGFTLAEKDQTLSGDLVDIKSRDAAAIAGLQLGVNRLIQDPIQFASLLQWYLNDGKATTSPRAWLDFSKTPLELVAKEPNWFSIGDGAGDETAVKVQLLALGLDTMSRKGAAADSMDIYLTLECLARGRRGDERRSQATYRIHGISLEMDGVSETVKIPDYAFYSAISLESYNMSMNATGGVYVAGAGNSFGNSGANQTINGNFKWDGDLYLNNSFTVNGRAYINGGLYTNSTAKVHFRGNAVITDGFHAMDGSILSDSSLYLGDKDNAANTASWNNQDSLVVGGDLVWISSYDKAWKFRLKVGRNAWLARNFALTLPKATDSFRVLGDLVLGDSILPRKTDVRGPAMGPPAKFYVKGKMLQALPASAFNTYSLSPRVDDSSYFQGAASILDAASNLSIFYRMDIAKYASILGGGGNNVFRDNIPRNAPGFTPPGKENILTIPRVPGPELYLDTAMTFSNPKDNPMDSLVVRAGRTDQVIAAMTDLDAIWSKAGLGTNISITPDNMNTLYAYMKKSSMLLNGYMVLRLKPGLTVNFNDVTQTNGFNGKMLMVVEGSYDANGSWPRSQDSTNIQVLLIRNNGALKNWGWPNNGNFAGIFYWENPPCGTTNLQIGANAKPPVKLWGSIIIGGRVATKTWGDLPYTATPCGTPPRITPNGGNLVVIRDVNIFLDIAINLPYLFKPANPGQGSTVGTIITIQRPVQKTRFINTTSRPYLELVGMFR